MARMSHWLGIPLLSLSLVGCVSQEKYNAMKLDRDQLAERLGQTDAQMQALQAERDAYKNQRDQILAGGSNRDALVSNLTQQLSQMQANYDQLNRQYQEALNRVGQGTVLPEPLNNALKQFAAENPDIASFDETRGIVKFKSDITFTSGKSDVTPRASEVIGRLASILNSPVAANYELQVAGHTDNQRVVHEETIRAGHKDNWYLSAHRAIAVSELLQRDGVTPNRLGVAGYADQHPIADNGSPTGRAQNRRVEVLILPTTVRSGAPMNNVARQSRPPREYSKPRRQAQPEYNKDASAGTYNK